MAIKTKTVGVLPPVTYYDIETRPGPEELIRAVMPEEIRNPVIPPDIQAMPEPILAMGALKNPDELPRPDSIKHDNEEKQEQLRAKAIKAIEDAEAKWNQAKEKKIAAWEKDWREKVDKFHANISAQKIKFIEQAALNAEIAELCMIGRRKGDRRGAMLNLGMFSLSERTDILKRLADTFPDVVFTTYTEEAKMLADWWDSLPPARELLCGFANKAFDNPFLLRRSLVLGVRIPSQIIRPGTKYNIWDRFHDLQELWQAGRREDYVKLKYLLSIFKVQPKTGDGRTFWHRWKNDPVDAIEYGLDDVDCTAALGAKILPLLLTERMMTNGN